MFGGCQQYLAPSLAHAHAHLIREQGLTVEHFDMVLEHLGDALEELDAALHELAEPSVRPCIPDPGRFMTAAGAPGRCAGGAGCGAARAGRAPGAPLLFVHRAT